MKDRQRNKNSVKTGYAAVAKRWVKALIIAVTVAAGVYALRRYYFQGAGEKEKIVEFVLAVLAIGFALYQFTDSAELKETIRDVAANATTRYINVFPHNMKEIEEVVGGSSKRLRIMADVVGYGSFSRPEEFFNYLQLLKQMRHGPKVDIELLVFGKTCRHVMLCDQFPKVVWEAKTRKSDEFHSFFNTPEMEPEPTTYEEFIGRLEQNHDRLAGELRREGVIIAEAPKEFPFFLWLQDDREAVVSFANRGPDAREISFRTREGKLIETFHSIFDEIWKRSSKSIKERPSR